VRNAIRNSGLDPRLLNLEVTETVALLDAQRTIDVLNELRGWGIGISIDDFGTGYSSLAYLHQIPFDTIKIDRSFVMRMEEEDVVRLIVESVVAIAHRLGREVIAEGVETEGDVARMLGIGCNMGQGYLFARPLDEAAIEALIERGDVPCGPGA
jgi:EAL domain-containing protein (putative c-di-GMP-specific phosphodiesterase class I)